MGERLFGTDGIRGRVGVDPVTPSFAYHLGRCLAIHAIKPGALVYVGRDTRESSVVLERYLAYGIQKGGGRIASLGVLPTPGISYCTKTSAAEYGIAITASHNPYDYNGFKLFSSDGQKLDEQSERSIEQELLRSTRSNPIGNIEDLPVDALTRNLYLEMLREKASQIGQTGLKGVVDCANGATASIAMTVFEGVFDDLHMIGDSPNGININKDVGSTSVEALQRAVRELKADIGIAFDGDGDRGLFVDDHGALVGGDQALYLLARRHLGSTRSISGVVGTVMSNHGLQLALDEIGIPFVRTDVGDKNVYDEMLSRNWRLGGEPSGHLIWRDVLETGDGIVIGLSVLEVMQHTQKPLRHLVEPVSMLPQVQLTVPSPTPQADVHQLEVEDLILQFNDRVKPGGRLLVRASGTEPLIRVMVEHHEAIEANRLAEELVNAISATI